MFFGLGHPGRQMLGRNPKAALLNSASLSLDFMTPGVLDPRITFTRASTATYFDSTGVMQSAAVDAPRWDYDPSTLQLRGLLLEDQRQNMTTNSQTFVGWLVGNATITTGAGIAPDGTNTLSKLAETAITGFHTNRFTATVVASTVYTVSVYAKAAERRYLVLGMDNSGADGFAATFDLQAGVISGVGTAGGAGSHAGSSMQFVGNGIYRCVISGHIGPNTTARLFTSLSLTPTGGSFPSYAGVAGSGIFVWGSQLEQGTFPTSYIPTTGSAVTRAQDVCNMTGPNFSSWFTNLAGSIVEEVSFPAVVGGMNVRLSEFSDGTTTNFLTLFPSFSGAYGLSSTIAGTPGTALTPVGTTTAGQVMRLGYTYGTNRTAVVNGGAVVSTPGGIAPTVNQLQFGNRPDGVRGGIIHVRSMKFWTRAFSDAELQSVTA